MPRVSAVTAPPVELLLEVSAKKCCFSALNTQLLSAQRAFRPDTRHPAPPRRLSGSQPPAVIDIRDESHVAGLLVSNQAHCCFRPYSRRRFSLYSVKFHHLDFLSYFEVFLFWN